MKHTQAKRTIKDYPTEIGNALYELMPEGNYTLTGRYRDGLLVWELDMWMIDSRTLLLVDVLLSELLLVTVEERPWWEKGGP